MQKKIQVKANMYIGSPNLEGGMRFRGETLPLNDEEKVDFMKLHGSFGWFLFSPNEFTDNDIPKDNAEDTNKTPSKRLRNVIFISWKQHGEKGDFETYYRNYMEKIIEKIKGTLDHE